MRLKMSTHVLALLCLLSLANCFEDKLLKLQSIPRCGETHSTVNGAIFYKPFESVQDYERCSWIIGVPEASGYSITIMYLGYLTNRPGSGQELLFTGVQYSNQSAPILTTHIPTSDGQFAIADANLIIVTFYSSELSVRSTGFFVEYESLQSGNVMRTSSLSTHHVLSSPTYKLRYPTSGRNYTAFELTAFLFPPNSGFYNGLTHNALYKKNGLQTGCRDSLYVYKFRITNDLVGQWQQDGRLCENLTSENLSHDNLMLILFQSDGSTQAAGFSFWYMGC